MLESYNIADMGEAPLGKASTSWNGSPSGVLIGLTVTVDGQIDSITELPIKWMVQLEVQDAVALLDNLIHDLSQTDEGRQKLAGMFRY